MPLGGHEVRIKTIHAEEKQWQITFGARSKSAARCDGAW